MRIGISRPSQTPDESYAVLETARRYGFEGVQLKPVQYREFTAAPEEFGKRYGALASLACGGLIFYPAGEPNGWEEQIEPIRGFASVVSAEHICICSGVYHSGATNEQVQKTASALTSIGTRVKQQNLVVSIHNHMDSLVENEEDIARLLALLEPDVCGLTLDTAHAARAGIPHVERLVHRFQKHLINVHLKDLDVYGKFCPLGRGTLDMAPILQALGEIGYDKWLIVDEESVDVSTEDAFRISFDWLGENGVALQCSSAADLQAS